MAKVKKPVTATEQPITLIPLQVHGQYIKDLSFETPGPFNLPENDNPSINLNIEVRVQHLKDNNFEVELHISAEATQKEARIFLMELCYAGIFGIGQMPEENVRPILLIECPRLLFPYARAIVSEITRDGGFVPLTLSPVDFAELYRQQHQQGQPAAPAAPAPVAKADS